MKVNPKRIQPATVVEETGAWQVRADGVDIQANAIVYVTGVQGSGRAKVKPVDPTDVTTTKGKRWVAKHAIPNGRDGIVVPAKMVEITKTGSGAGTPVLIGENGLPVTQGTAATQTIDFIDICGTVLGDASATTVWAMVAPDSPTRLTNPSRMSSFGDDDLSVDGVFVSRILTGETKTLKFTGITIIDIVAKKTTGNGDGTESIVVKKNAGLGSEATICTIATTAGSTVVGQLNRTSEILVDTLAIDDTLKVEVSGTETNFAVEVYYRAELSGLFS